MSDLVHIRFPLDTLNARLGIYPHAARRSLHPAGARGLWVISPAPDVYQSLTPSRMRVLQPLNFDGMPPGGCNGKEEVGHVH